MVWTGKPELKQSKEEDGTGRRQRTACDQPRANALQSRRPLGEAHPSEPTLLRQTKTEAQRQRAWHRRRRV